MYSTHKDKSLAPWIKHFQACNQRLQHLPMVFGSVLHKSLVVSSWHPRGLESRSVDVDIYGPHGLVGRCALADHLVTK